MVTSIIERLQRFVEYQAFGVCTEMGNKMGVATSSIRMYFIYASFLTFGSPVIVYLGLAFILNMRKHFRRRYSVWNF